MENNYLRSSHLQFDVNLNNVLLNRLTDTFFYVRLLVFSGFSFLSSSFMATFVNSLSPVKSKKERRSVCSFGTKNV